MLRIQVAYVCIDSTNCGWINIPRRLDVERIADWICQPISTTEKSQSEHPSPNAVDHPNKTDDTLNAAATSTCDQWSIPSIKVHQIRSEKDITSLRLVAPFEEAPSFLNAVSMTIGNICHPLSHMCYDSG